MASKLKARTPEEVQPGRIKGVLFGEPGAGKTWLALSFPAPFFIDTEGGASLARYQARLKASGGGYFGRDDGSLDPEAVLGQIEALATEKHPYKTLVIDSLSKIYQSIIAREQERLGDKDAFGASKKPAIAWARRLVTWLDRMDLNTWLVCHELTRWEGTGTDRHEAGKTADIWEKLIYELHLTLQVRKIGKGIREAVVAKSRLEGFPDFDRFYLQKDETDVGYVNFTERYKRDFIEAAVRPVILATPEEVAEIVRMLEIVKIPQETQDKWFAKAGVDSFSEFTAEQAQGVLSFLNSKMAPSTAKKAS